MMSDNHLLVLTQYLGTSSEVFLYRQVTAMERFRTSVAAYHHLNDESYPFENSHRLASRSLAFRAANASLRRLKLLKGWDAIEYGSRFRAVLRRLKPDLIHCHAGWAAARMIRVLEQTRTPVVVSFWGSDINAADRDPSYSARLRRLFARGDHFIFHSHYLQGIGVALGCPAPKSLVNHLGAEIPVENVSNRSRATPFHLASVARLSETKGPFYLLDAMRIINSRGVRVTLTMIGSGELRERVTARVSELDLADSVKLLGALPTREAMDHLSRSDALVLSSVRCADGQEEAFGVALIEAGARGLPVIGSNIGGIPEIIEHDRTGLLVPEKDPTALADAIERLATNPDLAAAMGRAGRQRVAEHFNLANQNAKVEEILLSVLHGRSQ